MKQNEVSDAKRPRGRKRLFALVFAVLIISVLLMSGFSLTALTDASKAPFKNDPMLATFLPTILPEATFGEIRSLKSLELSTSDGAARNVTLPEVVIVRARQKVGAVSEPDKLVIVVPGIGGIAKHSLNEVFTKPFVELGYTALILPNPVSVSFGFHRLPRADRFRYRVSVEALCAAIREVVADSENKIDVTKLKSVALAGYSLGARYSLSLRPCLRELVPRTAVRVLAVNPPLDFDYAVKTLDTFAETAREKAFLLYRAGFRVMWAKLLATSSGKFTDSPRLSELIYLLSPDVAVLPELIASSFLLGLQNVQDGTLGSGYQLLPTANARFASFLEASGETNETLIAEIQNVPRAFRKESVSLLLTRDDFLVREEDVNAILRQAGRFNLNVEVHDHGGHVGILFQKEFSNFVFKTL